MCHNNRALFINLQSILMTDLRVEACDDAFDRLVVWWCDPVWVEWVDPVWECPPAVDCLWAGVMGTAGTAPLDNLSAESAPTLAFLLSAKVGAPTSELDWCWLPDGFSYVIWMTVSASFRVWALACVAVVVVRPVPCSRGPCQVAELRRSWIPMRT